jgi:enediyne biosynthesis protein E4
MADVVRRHAARAAAVLPLVVLFSFARQRDLSSADRLALARQFRFSRAPLPQVTPSSRTLRTLRSSLRPIAAWISSVGAAVALNDLDGDGLPNDVCYVDVRSDEVVVAPVPGTPRRYAPFDLLRAPGCEHVGTSAPMGAVPIDADEDGRLDVLVYFWGRSPLLFRHNAAPGLSAASYDCREVVVPRQEWYTNAATFADVDGDGHPDLVIGNYFREGSQVLDPRGTSREMQMQDSMSLALNGGVDRLLLWSRDAAGQTFYREIPNAFPPDVARGWTLAIGAQDLDGDLLPELYFTNDFGPDRLLHNRSTPGHPAFELVEGHTDFLSPKSKVLGRDSFKGMGVDFADLNGDGRPDIFVSNITDPYALEESNFVFLSNGALSYRDESERLGLSRSGWSWDVRFGDFDNDGAEEVVQATGFVRGRVNRWPELHELAMGNDELLHDSRSWPRFGAGTDLSGDDGDRFYVRARDGRYADLARELGLDAPSVSRGIATADVDGDGRLDFAVANQWQASMFFHNDAPRTNNYLLLNVRRPVSSRASVAAIGAEVRVDYRDGAGARSWIGEVDGGNGHSGKRSNQLHVGLGKAAAADVSVRWRDGRGVPMTRQFHLAAGAHTLLLTEGKERGHAD